MVRGSPYRFGGSNFDLVTTFSDMYGWFPIAMGPGIIAAGFPSSGVRGSNSGSVCVATRGRPCGQQEAVVVWHVAGDTFCLWLWVERCVCPRYAVVATAAHIPSRPWRLSQTLVPSRSVAQDGYGSTYAATAWQRPHAQLTFVRFNMLPVVCTRVAVLGRDLIVVGTTPGGYVASVQTRAGACRVRPSLS